MAGPYDFTGQNIENTYQRVLQTPDGVTFYDGTGSLVNIGGGTGTPGQPNTSIQFNGNGFFSGSSNFTFNSASNSMILTGSMITTGSNLLIGTTTLTGSLNITGSTTQVGNNTLLGNTLLSGSIIISGALGTNNPTVKIYGDTEHNGYLRFDPVSTNIDPTISASYIYVSGSTNDLYFSQNGSGFGNTTRLRWLEGNLYTGLLHGGLISSASSTTFNISSGSGIIVNLNASLTVDPYPTIQFVEWGNLTNQTLTYRTTAIQSFLGIDSNGQIVQQTDPWTDGQYNTSISLGTVLHQNLSTINGTISYPNVAYGWKQRSYDFVKAFGPLKISGFTLRTSSSLGLTVDGGVAFAEGRNYQFDPNNPSYCTDTGTTVSKIFRYYQSGSTFVQDTNGGLGYTGIDTTQFNLNGSGSLTAVSPSKFYVHRIFWYPKSVTKGIVDYYGLAAYDTLDKAQTEYITEPFVEVPNTQQNAIFLGIVIVKGNSNFNSANDYRVVQGGLFRSAGTGGGSGGGGATTLAGLTDVSLTSPTYGDLLMYDTNIWINTKTLSGSYTLSGSLNVSGSLTGSLLGTASYTTTASYALNGGVTQLLAGPNISLSPTNGLGQVTVSSTGGGGVYGNTATGSYGSFFSTQTQNAGVINTPYSMSFNNIDITNGVTISGSASSSIKITNAGVYDLQFSAQLQKAGSGGGVANVLIWIRKNNIDLASTNTYIQLQGGTNSKTVAAWNWFLNAAAGDEYRIMWSTDDTNAEIYYDPTPTTGPAVPSVIATVARVDQFLSNTGSFTGSFTGDLIGTASWASNSISSSFARTASFVNTLTQNVIITGSLVIGTGSAGSTENTLILGPAPAGGVGEGGQILLQAPNSGGYTSASMIDNYQNQTRLLRGTNASSDAEIAKWNMQTRQMQLPAYNSVNAFSGTSVATLGVNSNGDILTTPVKSNTWFYDAYLINTQTTVAGVDTTINNISLVTQPNEAWSFEFNGVGQVSGAGGARFTVVYSAPAISSSVIYQLNNNALSNWVTNITTTPTPAQQSTTLWALATTDFHARIVGSFVNGASANTVTLKVLGFNNSQTVTLRPMSYLTARRII